MVISLEKFFVGQRGQSYDEMLVEQMSRKVATYLKSDDEATRQKGRKIESVCEKIAALDKEFDDLERVSSNVVKTPTDEFKIQYLRDDVMALEKVHGVQVKNLALAILEDAAKNNRIEYLNCYLTLMKLKP